MILTAEHYIEKGMEFEDNQEFYNAITCYEKAIEMEPENLTAMIKIGELYSYTHDIDKAMEIFNRVLQIDPKNRTALEYRLFFGEKC